MIAKCTWAMEAAATGSSLNDENRFSRGWPKSRSMARRTASNPKGGRWSWRWDRSAATSSPKRSERVAKAWPSLMKLGPASCSARASRSPGRPAIPRRRISFAANTTPGATSVCSSTNKAS